MKKRLEHKIKSKVILISLSFLISFGFNAQTNDSLFIVLSDKILQDDIIYSSGVVNVDTKKEELNLKSNFRVHILPEENKSALKRINDLYLNHHLMKTGISFTIYNLINEIEIIKANDIKSTNDYHFNNENDSLLISNVICNCKKLPTAKILISEWFLNKQNTIYISQLDYTANKKEFILKLLNYKHLFINIDPIQNETIFYETKLDFYDCSLLTDKVLKNQCL